MRWLVVFEEAPLSAVFVDVIGLVLELASQAGGFRFQVSGFRIVFEAVPSGYGFRV